MVDFDPQDGKPYQEAQRELQASQAAVTARDARALMHDAGYRPPERADPDQDWQRNPAKLGEDYDDCPRPDCATRDADPYYRVGDSTVFKCGCCGLTWCRNGKQAHDRFADQGFTHLKFNRSQDAEVGRVYSVPSQRFRDNYDRIDWSK